MSISTWNRTRAAVAGAAWMTMCFVSLPDLEGRGKLKVIAFGAHPDDCDFRAGGVGVKYVSQGHKVRFVSLTNGDAGHHEQGGGALGMRRRAEAKEAGRRVGIDYVVLDNHEYGRYPDEAEIRRLFPFFPE